MKVIIVKSDVFVGGVLLRKATEVEVTRELGDQLIADKFAVDPQNIPPLDEFKDIKKTEYHIRKK